MPRCSVVFDLHDWPRTIASAVFHEVASDGVPYTGSATACPCAPAGTCPPSAVDGSGRLGLDGKSVSLLGTAASALDWTETWPSATVPRGGRFSTGPPAWEVPASFNRDCRSRSWSAFRAAVGFDGLAMFVDGFHDAFGDTRDAGTGIRLLATAGVFGPIAFLVAARRRTAEMPRAGTKFLGAVVFTIGCFLATGGGLGGTGFFLLRVNGSFLPGGTSSLLLCGTGPF